MSERLQYACDEHGWCDYEPCPKCPKPKSSISVNVPKELFSWLVEYSIELRGAWSWKANSTHRNCEVMQKLDCHLKEAIAIRDSQK